MDYVRTLYKRRMIALPLFLIVFTIGAFNALRQTPIYQAHAQLLIEQETPNVRKIDQMFQSTDSYYNDEFYQTQYRILQSRTLAKDTIEAMGLSNAPRLGNGPAPKATFSISALASRTLGGAIALAKRPFAAPEPAPAPAPETKGTETAAQSDLIDDFLGGLSINPIRNSRIVEIRYDSTDPAFAAEAANNVAKAYIRQNFQLKNSTSKDAGDWLADRLAEQKRAVGASETALQAYREKNGAVSVADNSSNIVVQRLTDLNSALTKAKTERINKEALHQQLHRGARVECDRDHVSPRANRPRRDDEGPRDGEQHQPARRRQRRGRVRSDRGSDGQTLSGGWAGNLKAGA